MLSGVAPKHAVWESLLGETLKQRRWRIPPSLFREEFLLLETGLPYKKALFIQGYGDQHTHYLPAGAFLHSERLQHRPGFGGGGWKGGRTGHLQPFRRLYLRLQIAPRKGELQGKGN